jgi:hypothetical protein
VGVADVGDAVSERGSYYKTPRGSGGPTVFFLKRRECKKPIPVATRSKGASETARLLGLWVRMPAGSWLSLL